MRSPLDIAEHKSVNTVEKQNEVTLKRGKITQ